MAQLKEIVVISGKGGTGKTSLVAAFAALARNAVLADCDVDAADLHLLLKPAVRQTQDFSGGRTARIAADQCVGCGRCVEVCAFGAVSFDGPANGVVARTCRVEDIACEGCGVCAHFCPAGAIEMTALVDGQWFVSDTRFGPMVHARLIPGRENSGKLVSLIRKEAACIAREQDRDLVIADGSPGIGCPVIASITGADFVLVVTEPTLSGQHDLQRVMELTAHFGIPTGACINKFDINPGIAESITKTAERSGAPVLGRISYDTAVTRAQIAGMSVVEYADGPLSQQVPALWRTVADRMDNTDKKEE